MLASNPYVCRSYSGKTGRGPFSWGREVWGKFIQNFHKGKIYFIGENFVGKKIRLGKVLSHSQYFVTFPRKKVFPQI